MKTKSIGHTSLEITNIVGTINKFQLTMTMFEIGFKGAFIGTACDVDFFALSFFLSI